MFWQHHPLESGRGRCEPPPHFPLRRHQFLRHNLVFPHFLYISRNRVRNENLMDISLVQLHLHVFHGSLCLHSQLFLSPPSFSSILTIVTHNHHLKFHLRHSLISPFCFQWIKKTHTHIQRNTQTMGLSIVSGSNANLFYNVDDPLLNRNWNLHEFIGLRSPEIGI